MQHQGCDVGCGLYPGYQLLMVWLNINFLNHGTAMTLIVVCAMVANIICRDLLCIPIIVFTRSYRTSLTIGVLGVWICKLINNKFAKVHDRQLKGLCPYIRRNCFLMSSLVKKIQLKWAQEVWACPISRYSPRKYVVVWVHGDQTHSRRSSWEACNLWLWTAKE